MEQATITVPLEPAPIRHPKLSEVTSMPRPRWKGHWALNTHSLDQSDTFYRTLTGADLICKPQAWSVAISFDIEHHRFFIAQRDGLLSMRDTGGQPGDEEKSAPPPGKRLGEAGGAIRFKSPEALVKVIERMRGIGREPERISDKGAVVSVLYHDPVGLIVEAFAATGASAKAEELVDAETFTKRFS